MTEALDSPSSLQKKLTFGWIGLLSTGYFIVYILKKIELNLSTKRRKRQVIDEIGKDTLFQVSNDHDDKSIHSSSSTHTTTTTLDAPGHSSQFEAQIHNVATNPHQLMEYQNIDGDVSSRFVRTKLSLEEKLILYIEVTLLLFLTYLLLVYLPSGATASLLGTFCVSCVVMKSQVADELRRKRYDRLGMIWTLILFAASFLSLITYASVATREGIIYEGPARIVGYDTSVYETQSGGVDEAATRMDLEVAWGGEWGCPDYNGVQCTAFVSGALCESDKKLGVDVDDDDDDYNVRKRQRKHQRQLKSTNSKTNSTSNNAKKSAKSSNSTSTKNTTHTKTNTNANTTNTTKNNTNVTKTSDPKTNTTKDNKKSSSTSSSTTSTTTTTSSTTTSTTADNTETIEELEKEIEELKEENEKLVEEEEKLNQTISIETKELNKAEDKADTYYFKEKEEEEDVKYYKEEVVEEEEDLVIESGIIMEEEVVAGYYASVANEEAEIIEAAFGEAGVEVVEEIEDENYEYYAEEMEEVDEIVDEELDMLEDEISAIEDEKKGTDEDVVVILAEDDDDGVISVEVAEQILEEEVGEEEEIMNEEYYDKYYENTYSFDDDNFEDDWWSSSWNDVWGEYACNDLFDSDLEGETYNSDMAPGKDEWPFVNIYGSCNKCEAYLVDYYSTEHFNGIKAYQTHARNYAIMGVFGVLVSSILAVRQSLSPEDENEVGLLTYDGGHQMV